MHLTRRVNRGTKSGAGERESSMTVNIRNDRPSCVRCWTNRRPRRGQRAQAEDGPNPSARARSSSTLCAMDVARPPSRRIRRARGLALAYPCCSIENELSLPWAASFHGHQGTSKADRAGRRSVGGFLEGGAPLADGKRLRRARWRAFQSRSIGWQRITMPDFAREPPLQFAHHARSNSSIITSNTTMSSCSVSAPCFQRPSAGQRTERGTTAD